MAKPRNPYRGDRKLFKRMPSDRSAGRPVLDVTRSMHSEKDKKARSTGKRTPN